MAHAWRFFRAGGFDQVQITTGADLAAIGELDQKLWVALACPVDGLEFDARTLALIDTDHDGRVRASELITATRWAASMLSDVESLAKGSDSLPLRGIATSTPEGKLIHDTAANLLRSLGKPDADAIKVDDTKDAVTAFANQPFNGDGIVPVDAADDEAVRGVLADIVACTATPEVDRSGKSGVGTASLDVFWTRLAAHAAWLDAGRGADVQVLGADTPAAFAAFDAVRAKIDDFFGRCSVASFDPRALEAVNGQQAEYLAIAAKDLQVTADEVAHFPVAHVAPDASLPLASGVNPAWAERIEAFRARVAGPLVGATTSLTAAQWRTVCDKLRACSAWNANKGGAEVERLGADRVKALIAGSGRAAVEALIARDAAAEPMAKALESVERLVRYHRDLMTLANNFVSFRDFYGRRGAATFQVGRLYLDQRACDLCIKVRDAGKHATMAPLSKAYLVYCDLKSADGRTMQIAAAMTNGDVDNLMVGRNGVFYDRSGKDWDATVTKIVDNPISVRQAFWSPYKKLLRLIEDQITARAAAAEAASDARITGAATTLDGAVDGAVATEPPKPFDVGIVAALGVAVGGITAAIGALLEAFFGLGLWMPLGVVGLVLLISGPSMAIAWLKLRQRNLGPLLDANGWAVNAQAKLNVPLGASLTQVAALPSGSKRDLSDPFAERSRPWALYGVGLAVLALAVGWYIGKLDPYLPGPAKSTEVLGALAPAAAPAEPTPSAPTPPPPAAPAP